MGLEELEDLDESSYPESISDEIIVNPDSTSPDPETSLVPSFDEQIIDWEPDFDQTAKEISNLTTGIDLPSRIFSLAVEAFNIESGLFLTFESVTEYFIPFSSYEVDETTLRRCRISRSILEEHGLIFNGTNIHPSLSKDFLKNFLSKRLWDTIENLDMFVFCYHDKLFGLLLMFNMNINSNPQFFDFASFFTRKCSELFFNSRSKVINSLPPADSSSPVPVSELSSKIIDIFSTPDYSRLHTFKLVTIKCGDIVDKITRQNRTIDRFRIENDIFKMYSSMLFGNSFILKAEDCRIILCLTEDSKTNNLIIEHQMSSSLLSMLVNNQISEAPYVKVADFTLSDESLRSGIEKFISAGS